MYLQLRDPDATFPDTAVVLGTDGTAEEVPPNAYGVAPVIAGWTDDDSVLAVGGGEDITEFTSTTWSRGSASWTAEAPTFTWRGVGGGPDVLAESTGWVEPGGDRLLVTTTLMDVRGENPLRGRATTVDLPTGRVMGLPRDDGTWPGGDRSGAYVEWEGAACGPVWRDGSVPAVLDEGGRNLTGDGAHVVSVSGRFGDPCPTFAGNAVAGVPVPNSLAVWQERAWVYGLPGLVVAAAVSVLVLWRRRRRGPGRGRTGPLPLLWSFRT